MDGNKLLSDEQYTYKYYRDMYKNDVLLKIKDGAQKKCQFILDEDSYIYIHFLSNLGYEDSYATLEEIAPVLDEQLVYVDDTLKDIVITMWKTILSLSENGGTIDDLKTIIYRRYDSSVGMMS